MRESEIVELAAAIFTANPSRDPEECVALARKFVTHVASLQPTAERVRAAKLWDGYSEPFMKFWRNYPNPKGKGAAYTSWRKAAKTVGGEEKLLALVRQPILEARASESWLQGFIPLASTWLNQRRWEDSEGAYTPSD